MKKETLDFVKTKIQELTSAPSCSPEAKRAAQAWLDKINTPGMEEETRNFLAELERDLTPIDGLIGFAGSAAGSQVFGAEGAAKMLRHANEIKAAGAEYCDCPACTAVVAILDKKAEMLG